MLRYLVLSFALLFACNAAAESDYTIVIKDHRFTPAELTVPANTKITLLVKNEDASPEEFESHELKREKIIPGNSQAVIRIGPLEPGEYPFMGEFHQGSAQGKIIAK
jgi:plastocyanin